MQEQIHEWEARLAECERKMSEANYLEEDDLSREICLEGLERMLREIQDESRDVSCATEIERIGTEDDGDIRSVSLKDQLTSGEDTPNMEDFEYDCDNEEGEVLGSVLAEGTEAVEDIEVQ